jgi:antitoxin HicB
MLSYPLTLEEDEGTLLVTSPDFPELTTFGEDREEAIARAGDALEEAIAARMASRLGIPPPSSGSVYATLPTLTTVKLLLYQGMRDRGIGKAELARRLDWHLPQVDRVLNVQHSSRLEQMDAALGAIGLRLDVSARDMRSGAAAAVAEDAPEFTAP